MFERATLLISTDQCSQIALRKPRQKKPKLVSLQCPTKETPKRNNESVETDRLFFENSIVIDFATIGSVLEEKMKAKVSFLNFVPKPRCPNITDFKAFSSYFGPIGSIKFDETCCVKSLATLQHGPNDF